LTGCRRADGKCDEYLATPCFRGQRDRAVVFEIEVHRKGQGIGSHLDCFFTRRAGRSDRLGEIMQFARSETQPAVSEAEIIRQSMFARMAGLKWSVVASLSAIAAMVVAILTK
jgi:hypothetical protein